MGLQTPIDVVMRMRDRAGEQVLSRFRSLSAGASRARASIGGLNQVLGLLGASLSGGAIVLGFKRVLSDADAIAKAADRIGVTTTALQELQGVAGLTGMAGEEMDRALATLGKRLGEAATGVGKFRGMVGLLNLDTGSTEKSLDRLADAVAGTRSHTLRLRIASAAFGEELGARMIPLLRLGSGGVRDLRREVASTAGVLEDSLLRSAEKTNDTIALLTKRIKNEFYRVALNLAPMVERIARGFSDWAKDGNLERWALRSAGAVVKAAELMVRAGTEVRNAWLGGKIAFNWGMSQYHAFQASLADEAARIAERWGRPGQPNVDLLAAQRRAQFHRGQQVEALMEQSSALEAMARGADAVAELSAGLEALRASIFRPLITVSDPKVDAPLTGRGIFAGRATWGDNWSDFRVQQAKEAAEEEAALGRAHWQVMAQLRSKDGEDAKRSFEARVAWAKAAWEAETRFQRGASDALTAYARDAMDTYNQVADAVRSAFSRMEDQLVGLVTRGKLEFRAFVDAVIADLARLAIRQAITGPLAQALGTAFAPSATAANAPAQYEPGPWTGRTAGRQAAGGSLRVEVINQTGVQVEARQTRGTDGNQVLQVVLRAVAADVVQGGAVAQAISAAFGARRLGRAT